MQVPRFSPRISLIEMAPHPAPSAAALAAPPCPTPALPCLSPQTNRHHKERAVTGRIFQTLPTQTNTTVVLIYRISAPQGTCSDWKNLPGTAHTDRHHCCFNI